MPQIGEMKSGRDIGKTEGLKYRWCACVVCGGERWVRIRSNFPENQKCRTCSGRDNVASVRHKQLLNRDMLLERQNKGTLEHPVIGDIRIGPDVGKQTHDKYVFQACRICGKQRWVVITHGAPRDDRCRSCANPIRGKRLSSGRHIDSDGYYRILVRPEDPYFSMAIKPGRKQTSRYILEHRLIMAKYLGRLLHPSEFVHHKNGKRNDNRIENLELTTCAQHITDHHKGYEDGFTKGYRDGQDSRIKELERQIRELQTT